MKEQKLTIRISQDVLDEAKRYAREHGSTLTRLVTAYLERLSQEGDPLASGPITRGLAGSLPPTAERQEHRAHLEQKHRTHLEQKHRARHEQEHRASSP